MSQQGLKSNPLPATLRPLAEVGPVNTGQVPAPPKKQPQLATLPPVTPSLPCLVAGPGLLPANAPHEPEKHLPALPARPYRCGLSHLLPSGLDAQAWRVPLATSANLWRSALPLNMPPAPCKQSPLLSNSSLGKIQRRPGLELLQQPGSLPGTRPGPHWTTAAMPC